MLVKVCKQVLKPLPFNQKTGSDHGRKVIPMDTKEFRYLRFRAIGNMEKAGFNGNWDGFPYEHFEDDRPGYGYRSFINKRAHYEHNCLLPGALILMSDMSYRAIEDIKVGDEVISHLGPRKVTNVFSNKHNGPIYRIRATGMLDKVSFTGQHPIYAIPREAYDRAYLEKRKLFTKYYNNGDIENYKSEEGYQVILENLPSPDFLNAEDINLKDYLVYSNYCSEENSDDEIADIRIARLLGLYLAEGSIGGNRDKNGEKLYQYIQFSFNKDEIDLIKFVRNTSEELKIGNTSEYLITATRSGNQNCKVVCLYSAKFAKLAVKHCSRLARYKKLSNTIFGMPENWKREFLKGYFEGDGHIQPNGVLVSSTASKELALQLQMLLFSIGVNASLNTISQKTPNNSKIVKNSYGNLIYTLCMSTGQTRLFFNKDSSSVHKNGFHLLDNIGVLTKVNFIEEKEYKGYTYNIEVAQANTYVVNNIIVHNSALGIRGSIGDLPDAYLNKFIYPKEIVTSLGLQSFAFNPKWADLTIPELTDGRLKILAYPSQRNGDIEVLMRIDTKLVESAQVEPNVKKALARMIRMIDTGQVLTCSMGTNVEYSNCSACGNTARFSSEYCDCLDKRKGLISVVTANQVRDLLDRGDLRVEWLKHIIASENDINEIIKGASNRGVAVRNGELNHVLSFFELSTVGTPAYTRAIALEKIAKQYSNSDEFLQQVRAELGDDIILDLYGLMQKEGKISSMCEVR